MSSTNYFAPPKKTQAKQLNSGIKMKKIIFSTREFTVEP
jgi:hypothetical protein